MPKVKVDGVEVEVPAGAIEDLFTCVPAGARFKFSATVIRFRLAEAFIRTLAPAAGAGS